MNDLPPSLPETNNKLSTVSLVLGVLAIVPCSAFAGIPAIITGHIALNRANKSPAEYGGKGLAKAGLIMGYLSVALGILILPALMLPALAKAKQRGKQVVCVNNLKQVALAVRVYSKDHGDKFSPDFLSMSNELVTPKILVCPADKDHTKATNWSAFGSANVSYEFLLPSADEKKLAPETPMLRCPIHGSTAMADGSVRNSTRGRNN